MISYSLPLCIHRGKVRAQSLLALVVDEAAAAENGGERNIFLAWICLADEKTLQLSTAYLAEAHKEMVTVKNPKETHDCGLEILRNVTQR